ncbi:MarR family transcriptional regulator [Streptomyces sp. NPDC048604]|uniref:MarR family transcriptional regulator n=1 Tax=Streptomyces sp. NPDC048604 TaxID=3365578 RepID=UPI0037181C8C
MTTTNTTDTVNANVPAALNSRVIGVAHYAVRACLEGVLGRHGATFQQSVTLRVVVVAGGSLDRDALVRDVIGSLKVDESEVRGVIGELTAAGLLEEDPTEPSRLRPTDAGRELYEITTAESAELSARLYAGIPAEDLAVAGRVLGLIRDRANAELAAA